MEGQLQIVNQLPLLIQIHSIFNEKYDIQWERKMGRNVADFTNSATPLCETHNKDGGVVLNS